MRALAGDKNSTKKSDKKLTQDIKEILSEISLNQNSNYLMLFLSAGCSSCELVCQKWNDLLIKNGREIIIIGITYSDENELNEFKIRNNPLFNIYKLKKKYSLFNKSPQTLLVLNKKEVISFKENELETIDLKKIVF